MSIGAGAASSGQMHPCARDGHRKGYQRHRPEESLLYRVVQGHWRTVEAELDLAAGIDGSGVPAFVRREMEAYLRCGVLAYGFVRVRCGSCAASRLVALSCKRRGFCPSCIGRRMNDTAARLVDAVWPRAPMRQWVLTVPHGLRHAMAHDPDLASAVPKIFVAAVTWQLRRRMRRRGCSGALKTGSVTVIQRFDSAIALNAHFHSLFIDGVYTEGPGGALAFHRARAPSDEDVMGVADRVFRQVSKLCDAAELVFPRGRGGRRQKRHYRRNDADTYAA